MEILKIMSDLKALFPKKYVSINLDQTFCPSKDFGVLKTEERYLFSINVYVEGVINQDCKSVLEAQKLVESLKIRDDKKSPIEIIKEAKAQVKAYELKQNTKPRWRE
jgi:hypothetical protein